VQILHCVVLSYLIEKIVPDDGLRVALCRGMESIIEFPKSKTPTAAPEPTHLPPAKKIFNIADWKPKYTVQLSIPGPDTWPYCAA
jgi:hypothetical protein